MTSKEALEYIAKEKGIDNITGAVEYNWKLYQPCFQTIEKDLDRLEKLEKVVGILQNIAHFYVVKHTDCLDMINYRVHYNDWGIEDIEKEEYELLKEVLEDEK